MNEPALPSLGIPTLTGRTIPDRLREFREFRRAQGLEMQREGPVPYVFSDPPECKEDGGEETGHSDRERANRARYAASELGRVSRRIGNLRHQLESASRPETRPAIEARIAAAIREREALKAKEAQSC